MQDCDNVTALAQELGVARRRLYKWRDQAKALAGIQEVPAAVQSRISKLEEENRRLKKLTAEQALAMDFFKGALEKVGALGRKQSDGTGKGSTNKFEKPSSGKKG